MIDYLHDQTGLATLYAVLSHPDGKRWNTSTGAWETLTVANWSAYAIAMTETPASSYRYLADMPEACTSDTVHVAIYERTGSSAAPSDTIHATGTYEHVDTKTVAHALAIIAAAASGLSEGTPDNPETFYGLDGTTKRIEATMDEHGNRTAVDYY